MGTRSFSSFALLAGASLLGACNLIFGVDGGLPAGGTGGSTSTSTTASTTHGTTGSSTSTSSSSSSSGTGGSTSTSSSSTGTGGMGPFCDGTDPADPDGTMPKVYGQRVGGSGAERGGGVVLKGGGNVLLTGMYAGADTKISGNTLSYAGGTARGTFLARYTAAPDSNLEFLATLGGAGAQVGRLLGMTSSRNGLVAGSITSSIDVITLFPTTFTAIIPAVAPSTNDAFIAQFDEAGKLMWGKAIGGPQDDMVLAVASDYDDVLVLIATASGSAPGPIPMTFGCTTDPVMWTPDLTNGPTSTLFLARYGSDGACQWQRRLDVKTGFVDPSTPGQTVAMTATGGGIYLAGGAIGASNDVGGPVFNAYGGVDVFAARLNTDGSHGWSRAWGDSGDQWASSIQVDPCGHVVLGGAFKASATFDGTVITDPSAPSGQHGFVAQFDQNPTPGTPKWTRMFSGQGLQDVRAIAVNGASEIAVGGVLQDTPTIDLGTGALPAAANATSGTFDGYVLKLDGAGKTRWAKRFAGAGNETVTGVSINDQGNTGVVGDFDGTYDFGFGPEVATGTDMYWIELAP